MNTKTPSLKAANTDKKENKYSRIPTVWQASSLNHMEIKICYNLIGQMLVWYAEIELEFIQSERASRVLSLKYVKHLLLVAQS